MFIINNDLFYVNPTTKECRLAELSIGDKVWCAEDPYSKSKCLEIEEVLNKVGYHTRSAMNPESRQWSVAIVE